MKGEKYCEECRCFESTLVYNFLPPTTVTQSSGCYEQRCWKDGSQIVISIKIEDNWENCYEKDKILEHPDFNGQLTCPDPIDTCQFLQVSCHPNCQGDVGICNETVCQCFDSSFTGPDCSIPIPIPTSSIITPTTSTTMKVTSIKTSTITTTTSTPLPTLISITTLTTTTISESSSTSTSTTSLTTPTPTPTSTSTTMTSIMPTTITNIPTIETPNPSPTDTLPTNSGNSDSKFLGVIYGTIFGGVFILLLISISYLFYRSIKKRKERRERGIKGGIEGGNKREEFVNENENEVSLTRRSSENQPIHPNDRSTDEIILTDI